MAGIVRSTEEGINAVAVARDRVTEWFVTARPPGREERDGFALLGDWLDAHPGVSVMRQFSVCNCRPSEAGMGSKWPHICMGAGGASPCGFLYGVEGVSSEAIVLDGRNVGSGFTDNCARYVWLGPFESEGCRRDGSGFTSPVFRRMSDCLQAAGAGFGNLARTWFFLRDIGACYDAFNKARLRAYKAARIARKFLPASTCVGFHDHGPAEVVGACMAVVPCKGGVNMRAVASPAQCAPSEYGSFFSRAVEISAPDHRRLLVSGTASIGIDGRTLDGEDSLKQVGNTLDAVGVLLNAAGFDWADVVHGVGYVRDRNLPGHLAALYAGRGLDPNVFLTAEAVICRPELSFEMELEAIVPC